MANSNAPRFLSDGTTDYGLQPNQLLGIVTEAFRRKTAFWDNMGMITQFKSIGQGQSHQFYRIEDIETTSPEHHTPGTELLGQDYQFTNGTITVDDILVRHHDVPIDQATLSDFDVMAQLGGRMGRRLAITYDQRLAIMGLLAARTAALTDFHNGGNVIARPSTSTLADRYPTTSTGASNFRQDAADLALLMDQDNVPEDGRFLFIDPQVRSALNFGTDIFNRDYNPATPNTLNQRVIGELEGFNLIVTNHLPSTDISNDTSFPSKYRADFSNSTGLPAAVAFCGAVDGEASVGVLQAMGISTVAVRDERRNTTFLKAQMMIGADVLSPYCAGEIRVAA